MARQGKEGTSWRDTQTQLDLSQLLGDCIGNRYNDLKRRTACPTMFSSHKSNICICVGFSVVGKYCMPVFFLFRLFSYLFEISRWVFSYEQ